MAKETTLNEIGKILDHVVEHMATKDDVREIVRTEGLSCCRFGRHQPKLIALVARTPSG
jgi:hypothetical protein